MQNGQNGSLVSLPPQRCDAASDASCKNWFFSNKLNVHRPHLTVDLHETTVAKGGVVVKPFDTVVLFASCSDGTRYSQRILTTTLQLLRVNVINSTVIAASCRAMPSAATRLVDHLLINPCAAIRGYDAGLWQQAYLFAVLKGLWKLAKGAIFLNDSVFGPRGPVSVPNNGIRFGATWRSAGIGSAAAVLYGRDVIRHPLFNSYWTHTRFFCGKWGSMFDLEGKLAKRYTSRFECDTYSNDIDEFSRPAVPPARLPFYKHKNPPYDLRSVWVKGGSLPDVHSLRNVKPAPVHRCALA